MPSEKLTNRLRLLPALLAWGLLALFVAPPAAEFAEDYFLRRSLSQDAETFYQACLSGRTAAINDGQAVGVFFGETEWFVSRGAEIIASGVWNADTKIGSNIPDRRFFYSGDGSCNTDYGNLCGVVGMPANDDGTPHVVALASSAPRIYTISFGADGSPQIVYDDF